MSAPKRIYAAPMDFLRGCLFITSAVRCADTDTEYLRADIAEGLVEALRGLYEHTKNNHCVFGLNEKAKQALAAMEGA